MADTANGKTIDAQCELDVVIAPGISVHVFGNIVGIYCDRIEAGRGFAEMPLSDFEALLRHFGSAARPRNSESGD